MTSDTQAVERQAEPRASSNPPSPFVHSLAQFTRGYEEEGRLLGVECAHCGFRTLTVVGECPQCHRRDGLRETVLPPEGVVEAFTLQNVPAEEFLNEAPYAYAIIRLKDGTRVSGWLPAVKRPEDLRIGDAVRWVRSYKAGMVFEKAGPQA
jgi:uncharacterized OB-fold protein